MDFSDFLTNFRDFYDKNSDDQEKIYRCETVSDVFLQYLKNMGKIKYPECLDDSNDSNDSNDPNDSNDSNDSNDPNDPNDSGDSDDAGNTRDFYESGIELCNGQLVVLSNPKDLIMFDENCLYHVMIDGLNINNFGEGDATSSGHTFQLFFVNGKWTILDSFVNQRGITMYDVDINELNSFIKQNEKKFDCDYYNKFFQVNIINYDNITNLDFFITEYSYI